MDSENCSGRLTMLNIVPMLPHHRTELAADTLNLYRRGCITESAFIMTLVPEGNLHINKPHITYFPNSVFWKYIRKSIRHFKESSSIIPLMIKQIGDLTDISVVLPKSDTFPQFRYFQKNEITDFKWAGSTKERHIECSLRSLVLRLLPVVES